MFGSFCYLIWLFLFPWVWWRRRTLLTVWFIWWFFLLFLLWLWYDFLWLCIWRLDWFKIFYRDILTIIYLNFWGWMHWLILVTQFVFSYIYYTGFKIFEIADSISKVQFIRIGALLFLVWTSFDGAHIHCYITLYR